MEETIVGIDVGTTKVCTLVAEVDEREKLRIVGVGVVPSQGMRRGVITNIDEATQAIARSVEEAERVSGHTIQSAYVGVGGSHISSLNSRGAVVIGRADRPITQEDVNRAMDAAQAIAIPHNRQIMHAIPRQFTVDGQDGIPDPAGMFGVRLEVEAHIVTATATAIRNLVSCVQAAGIAINELVLQSLASAEAVLRPDEKKMGVVLADIGGGTTDIAIFIEGSVWHTLVWGVGGDHLTNDIAVGLRTPFGTAEELKTHYGHAVVEDIDSQEYVDINTFGDNPRQSASRRDLATIITARTEEMFEFILREIKRSGYDGLLPAGLVLTGGTAELGGVTELAATRLQMPVRIGMPTGVGGMVAKVSGPSYATAVGLLLWGLEHGPLVYPSRNKEKGWTYLYDRFLEILKAFLPR